MTGTSASPFRIAATPRPAAALAGVAGLVCVLAASGCGPGEDVRAYEVPKPHLVYQANHVDETADVKPTRMVAAIVPHDGQGWFFKLTGEPKAASRVVEPFWEFVQSLEFDEAGLPEWTLPDGWKEQPGDRFRYATIEVPVGDESTEAMELSVSALPGPQGDFDAYVLKNVNRWRGQLNLDSVEQDDLYTEGPASEDGEVRKVPLGERKVVLVNLVGETSTAPASRPPFAGMGGGAAPFAGGADGPPRTKPRPPADEPGVTWTAPDEWKQGQLSRLRKAAFVAREDGRQVEITVIALPEQVGSLLLPNVNRWRREVGLAPIESDALQDELSPIEIDGHDGHYVEMTGPGTGNGPETTLAALVVAQGRSWFVKLRGDPELAEREKDRFRAFLKTLRFETAGS